MAGTVIDWLTGKKKKKATDNDFEAAMTPDSAVPAEPEPEKPNFLSRFIPEDKEAFGHFLLNAGAGMMAAGSPSLVPQNFLGNVGKGLQAGAEARQNFLSERGIQGAANAKEQRALAEAEAAQSALEKYKMEIGEVGPNGMTNKQLMATYLYALETGDETTARQVQAQLQTRQEEAAKKGLQIDLDTGEYTPLPGYGDGLEQIESQKAAGRVSGEESQRQTDDIREYNLYVEQARAAGIEPELFDDWMKGNKRAGAAQTNVTVGAGVLVRSHPGMN